MSAPLFHIILYQPEIPPNTGNIIRLCANSGAHLHLIEPLGFTLSDKHLRRAGLDYHTDAHINVHTDFTTALETINFSRLFAFTTRARQRYDQVSYADGDAFLFGPETRGLPSSVLDTIAASNQLRLPMRSNSRSLNLSNCVAIAVFEAWRQTGFAAGA